MNAKSSLVVAALVVAATLFADDRGMPVFGDSFDVVGTFAENWVSKKCASEGGVVRIPHGAGMHMRGATPLEFVAELDVTATVAKDFEKRGQKWGGFCIEGFHFAVQPNGLGFCVWKLPEDKRSSGKYVKVPDFAPGKSVRLRLVRKTVPGGVKYSFHLNGAPAGEFIAPAPRPKKGADGGESYAPLGIGATYTDIVVDNFLLSTVRHDDDSPNMVFNSGFEHDEDGTPTHYGFMGSFDYVNWPWRKFRTDYLKRYQVDRNERHSGRQSLRVIVNGASSGSIQIAPWRTGTVKDAAGVFSVWMKASVDGLKVNLHVDAPVLNQPGVGQRTVEVGREWARYEVTQPKLKGKGLYSPLMITVPKAAQYDALLWIDDLQFEIVPLPEGGAFDPEKSYATPYKPCEADKDRFGAKQELPPPAALAVKRLPAGVKPSVDLDAWADKAFRVTDFWFGKDAPQRKTEGFLACDDENLYVGMRNFGEPADRIARPKRGSRDLDVYTTNGLELFFKPNPEEGYFHLAMSANGDQFDLHAGDLKWDGKWTVETKANAKLGATDYFVTVPFADFAPWGLSATWLANLCRNDRAVAGAEQYVASGKAEAPNFRNEERWNALSLPADVVSRWAGKAKRRAAASADAVLGRLDFYMNEDFAQWRVTGEDGKVTVVQKPLKEIPMGTNAVTFAANGRTYTDTVVRLPYRKGAMQVNRWTRSIVHDGRNEVFTGIGIGVAGYFGYRKDANPFPAMFDMLKAEGFRHFLYMSGSRSGRQAESRAILEASRERGFLCAFWGDYDIWNYDDDLKYAKLKPVDDVPLEKTVELTRQFDHIVTHLVVDEPELYKKSEWTRAWLEKIKPYYPYAPVQMNNTVMGVPSRHGDLKTDILMLDDYLSNNEGRTVDSVVKHVDEMRAVPGGKPCWYFISGDIMSLHYKNLSYAEQTAQSWGCICAGCTGLSWYFDIPRTEGSYLAMVDVNREVQALAPVILSEELCGSATCDQPKSRLRHLTRTRNGAWYVLTCNIDAKPLDRVTYVLPEDAPRNGTVEVLYENRTLPLKDGAFTDAYAGHARHLYRIR